MGQISQHPLAKWREQYGLDTFVETGTNTGKGVHAALKAGFERVYTIEANPRLSREAAVWIGKGHGKRAKAVEFVVGESPGALGEVLPRINAVSGETSVLWWLDAHYPAQYGTGDAPALPLADEVTYIATSRNVSRDVFVLDDLRIYGEKSQAGPLPGFLKPGDPADRDEIVEALGRTHDVKFDRRDGCYLLAFPRPLPD